MIKKLKKRMLITIMFFITIILVALIAAINVIPAIRSYNEAISFLNQAIIPNDIHSPSDLAKKPNDPDIKNDSFDKKNPDMLYHSNLISINLDQNDQITDWFSNRENLYEDSEIQDLAVSILSSNKDQGICDGYYYVYRKFPSGTTISLLDNRVSFHNLQTVCIISIISAIFVWVLLLFLSIYLVNRMTKPIAETFEKQRQFIADAGHELKTPVAVISANADVLEKEVGNSKWLSYIQTETKRMNSLIKNLMTLAQIDDDSVQFVHTRFDLSQAILSAALPYESLAFENGTVMEFDIAPEIFIKANKEQMEQLVIILISNAIKYGKERGLIRISLFKQHKSVLLRVFNTGTGIPPEECDKIFERFYRVEKERSRKSGSYGLGLSIAKSIVDEHKGKISVQSNYGSDVTFEIELPEK